MIRVNDDYIVDVDALNYTAKRDKHKVDKNGNPVYQTVGYYRDLEHAIKGIVEDQERDFLSKGEHSLADAIKAVSQTSSEFEQALRMAFNEANDKQITVMLDNGAIMPTKAHEDDAGFDLYAPERLVVMPHDSGVIDTGVHMAIPSGYVGMIKSKSGLNVNRGILCEGVVDSGYSGSIVAKIYNHSGQRKIFEKGDKLTQIVIMPIPRVKLVEGIVFSDTERGDNGFGSSGK